MHFRREHHHFNTYQSSVSRFIEDNWQLARIGKGTFDQMADRLTGLLDVSGGPAVFIDPRTGE